MSARARGGRGAARGGAARGRRGPRGRVVVALALVTFVLVGSAVIWRRLTGIENARELRALGARRAQLVAERAALEGAVRTAAARAPIEAAAERRLGMRVPADTQSVILTRPRAGAAPGAELAEGAP